MGYFSVNGAAKLYYDNVEKFETTSDGISLTGSIKIPDDKEVKLGTNTDLRLFHTGNQNYIQSYNGNFNIQSFSTNNIYIKVNESENAVVCNANGAVELYHNNSRVLETYSAGILVNSTVKVTGSNADLRIEAVGAGGHVKFVTTGADRWYVEGSYGHFLPTANNTYDIGNTSYRVRNIYTNDLHLSNEGHSNDVDGTWGNWTIQEGESDLFLKNNRSGKKYKFNLTEVS